MDYFFFAGTTYDGTAMFRKTVVLGLLLLGLVGCNDNPDADASFGTETGTDSDTRSFGTETGTDSDTRSLDCSKEIPFYDAVEQSIRNVTGVLPPEPLTFEVVQYVTDLSVSSTSHYDYSTDGLLRGVECLQNLQTLKIEYLEPDQLWGLPSVREDVPPPQHLNLAPLQHLSHLTALHLPKGAGVVDLSPLAQLSSLAVLDLQDNLVQDIGPLGQLTQLKSVNLNGNLIEDISPLANLTGLTSLELAQNQISNMSTVAHLTSLTNLNVGLNQIQDVSPLLDLTLLTDLNLSENQIQDIASIQHLTFLTDLNLSKNQIQDIAPLQQLSHLTVLDLRQNSISDISVLTPLTQLSELWVSGDGILSLSPLVANAGLAAGDTVSVGLPDCLSVPIQRDLLLLQQRGITLQSECNCSIDICNGGVCSLGSTTPLTCSGCLHNRSGENCEVLPPCAGIISLDPWVEQSIRSELNMPEGHITAAEMERLAGELEIWSANPIYENGTMTNRFIPVLDLVGLHCATNLTSLEVISLGTPHLEPIGSLSGLKTLELSSMTGRPDFAGIGENSGIETLILSGVPSSNVSSLSILPNLSALEIRRNGVDGLNSLGQLKTLHLIDIGPHVTQLIRGLEGASLVTLDLANNDLTDIGVLESFTGLQTLLLNDNQLSDIGPLSGIPSLTTLNLQSNGQISDISSLNNLVNLQKLNLGHCAVSDIRPLSGLTQLTWLFLAYNSQISDISPLNGLLNLHTLSLSFCALSDISSFGEYPALMILDLQGNLIYDFEPLLSMSLPSGSTVNIWNNTAACSSAQPAPSCESVINSHLNIVK